MLTQRQQEILYWIVQLYTQLEEPIGSKTLLKETVLQVSSATVRNDMLALEKAGLLLKTHSSSGRIPSFTGYRYYVDELIAHNQEIALQEEDAQAIEHLLRGKHQQRDIGEVVCKGTEILSALTGYPTFMLEHHTPICIDEFQLILLSNQRLVAIVLTDTGQIDSQLFDLPEIMDSETLQRLTVLLNDELRGLTLDIASQRLKLTLPIMMQRIITYPIDLSSLVDRLRNHLETQRYFVSGKNYLFDLIDPETQMPMVQQLFELLDGSVELQQIVESNDVGVNVLFGHDISTLYGFNVVLGTFVYRQQQFSIGLLANDTMPYQRIIAIMRRLIEALSNY